RRQIERAAEAFYHGQRFVRAQPSKYAKSNTRFRGMTAREWGEQAKAADWTVCERAAQALHHFGSEGVPVLLDALDSHTRRERIDCLFSCISWLPFKHVHPDDLGRLLPYLEPKYVRFNIRRLAVAGFRLAGPRAAPYTRALAAYKD